MKITPVVIRHMRDARVEVAGLPVDYIVARLSAFPTLRGMVEDSLRTGYRPTMRLAPVRRTREEYIRAAMTEILADAYDKATYLPLAKSVKVFSGGKQLAMALADIMEEDDRAGRPLTCALVVSSVRGMPGDGFFTKAVALGYQMPYGEDRFWKSQCQALGVTP